MRPSEAEVQKFLEQLPEGQKTHFIHAKTKVGENGLIPQDPQKEKYWLRQDESVVEYTVPLDLVTAMRDRSRFCSHESIEEFMQGFKERQYQYNAMLIDASSVEAFVASLRLLKILMNEDEFREHNIEITRRY